MKVIIPFLFIFLVFHSEAFAQSYPYQEKWNNIEQQELDGLLKSTLPLVDEIYNQAQKDNRPQDWIKALLYQFKIILIAQDDKKQEAQLFNRFKSEISKAEPIEKSILQSILAGLLNEYYQNNQYRLTNRADVDLPSTDDFLTWSSNSFQKEITALYDASISQVQQLKDEVLGNWLLILDTAEQNRELKPTLYDLLAHRAIDFYKKNDQLEKATLLIQGLLDQHASDPEKNAYLYNRLVGLELEKNADLFNRLVNLELDNERITKLKALSKLYPKAWYTSEILLQLGQSYQQHSYYKVLEDAKKPYLDSVLAIGDVVNRLYPKTRANVQLKEIVGNILSPQINIRAERFNIPGQAIPVFVSHKNISKLYVKILSHKRSYPNDGLDHIFGNLYTRRIETQTDLDSILSQHSTIQSYSIDLKKFDDYQHHSTLVKFDALNKGEYIAILSADESFKIDSNKAIAIQPFQISNNAVVIRGEELLLTDRESGKPLKNTEIAICIPSENSRDLDLIQKVVTNGYGIAKITHQEHLRNGRIICRVKDDEVYISINYYKPQLQNNSAKEKEKIKVSFFTDRGIYRPGQVVYFKGILYKQMGEQGQVLSNYQTTVQLFDSNAGNIGSLNLTSNEYGSVFGSFILPQGKLTGDFYIKIKGDQEHKTFRVEEYKRPTFEVILDTVKEPTKIGEEVVTTGKVQAFSGAFIDQAKIEYRVTRESNYPYWIWSIGIRNNRYSAPEEITVGETKADNEGKFTIKFVAKPAEEKPKDGFRFYNYTVQITATDINGETHTVSQTLSVGDKSILLNIPLVQKINIDYLDSIPLQTTNLNGQKVTANGNIRLTKLNSPNRVLKRNVFEGVDYMLVDSLTFIKLFPHLPYQNERDINYWKKGETVLNKNFKSTGQAFIKLNDSNKWQEGSYLLEAYVLDGQDTLRIKQHLQLHKSKSKKPIDKELFRVSLVKPIYKPGERVEVLFSSAANNVTVLVEVEKGGKIVKREQVILNKGVKIITYPINQNDKDQVFVHYYMGKYNTIESGTIKVPILQPTADLVITTSTFRDKLQPGQEETWELKISGADKDKLSTEVLTLMYDASLDQFVKNRLSPPNLIKNTNSIIPRWNTYNSYGLVYGNTIYKNRFSNNSPLHVEDLQRFGFSFSNPLGVQNNYLYRLSKGGTAYLFERQYKQNMEPNALAGRISGSTIIGSISSSDNNAPTLDEVTVTAYGTSKSPSNHLVSTGAVQELKIRGGSQENSNVNPPLYVVDGIIVDAIATLKPDNIQSFEILKDASAIALYGVRGINGVVIVTTKAAAAQIEMLKNIQTRKNLKETAFFYPELRTDEEGNIKIQFTAPEKLTGWKFMALAHTADLKTAYLERSVQTSKDLMVVPNAPRFLRVGDELILSTKIINLSESSLTGSAKLMFFDAITMQPLDSLFPSSMGVKEFNAKKGGSTMVSWQFKVPDLQQTIAYRIVASAGNFTDGEESVLPILPNKVLVTETKSLYAKEGQQKNFTLSSLATSNSTDSEHVRLTLELASNPIWYAIQAIPYLKESSYESSEQLFSKLYGSLVSKHLIDASPKIKTIFEEWNKKDKLQSRLETNEELKMLLIEETPWVKEAENEEIRMKRLALLFDLNNLKQAHVTTFQKLAATQLESGAFPWLDGGTASQLITTHIIAGFGHLKALGINDLELISTNYNQILSKAVNYLDSTAHSHLSTYSILHYLYARSYFQKEYPLDNETVLAAFKKLDGDKFNQTLQSKAMLALIYQRFGERNKANSLIKSLKDYAVQSDELGMYWKENASGWEWWQSPIETQSVLIEAFQEVADDKESIEQMKIWLLKNKQTNHWASTKATTEAIYSLLLTGKDWLSTEDGLEVKIGDKSLNLKNETSGTGYIKTTWSKSEINPEMAHVRINKTSPGAVWGGLYWQYFQSLDKIKASANGVQVEKMLFLKKNTEKGVVLNPITEDNPIQIGDVVTVRLIIHADRVLQFMHLKDMRASGLEPIHVLSSYKWQDGLGYYESTRDAATHFFIDRMPKGTYVFEYDLRANNAGFFSNGITTLQNIYAPEMNSYSEGSHIKIIPAVNIP